MTGPDQRQLSVRAVLDDEPRRRQVRSLVLAAIASDALLVAVVLVGMAADWPVWVIVPAALLPVVVGGFAARTAFVLHRQGAAQPVR